MSGVRSEGVLTVDDAGSASQVTLASLLTELQAKADLAETQPVSLATLPALVAGAANIGDVDVLSIAAGDNNIGNVDLASALPAGANNIGDVDLASAIPAGSALIGRVNLDPQTGNGLTIFRSLDLDETEEEVKATAGAIYGMWVTNTATATRWIKFYNATAANVTVGTTTPVLTIGIPGNSSDDISGLVASAFGIAFSTAITVAATTGVADADVGAPGVNDVVINLFYS